MQNRRGRLRTKAPERSQQQQQQQQQQQPAQVSACEHVLATNSKSPERMGPDDHPFLCPFRAWEIWGAITQQEHKEGVGQSKKQAGGSQGGQKDRVGGQKKQGGWVGESKQGGQAKLPWWISKSVPARTAAKTWSEREACRTHRTHLRVLGDNFFPGPGIEASSTVWVWNIQYIFLTTDYFLSRVLWKVSFPGQKICFFWRVQPTFCSYAMYLQRDVLL